MIIPKLQGRRAFVLKRCSSNSQVGTSIRIQDAGLAQLWSHARHLRSVDNCLVRNPAETFR